jgi:hypothetical protein
LGDAMLGWGTNTNFDGYTSNFSNAYRPNEKVPESRAFGVEVVRAAIVRQTRIQIANGLERKLLHIMKQ